MAKSKKSGKKPKTTRISAKDENPSKETLKEEKGLEEKTEEKEKVTEKVEKEVENEKETKKDDAEKKSEVKSEEKAEKTEKSEKSVEKKEKAEKVEKKEKEVVVSEKKQGFFKRLFSKKYVEQESVLTIFKSKKIWGAILGEVFGTMFLTMIIFTLGLYQPLYIFFIVLAVSAAVFRLSGANLNPINTVGMMASRRMSAIRGVLYLLSQLVGAWLGFLIVSTFIKVSAGISGGEAEIPGMTMADAQYYWVVTFAEFLGAAIIGYFFARAWHVRKNILAFSAISAGGLTIAMIVVYLISYTYFGLTGNFMLNPAIALMYQILPTSADGVGELLLEILKALFTYVLFPMVGGVVGFFIADVASTFAEEENKA